jgi:hypothetical protein
MKVLPSGRTGERERSAFFASQEGARAREPFAPRSRHALRSSLQGGQVSLRARRVCEPANPVRKGFAVVLARKKTNKVVPYRVRKLTVPRSCEATPKERPWRSPPRSSLTLVSCPPEGGTTIVGAHSPGIARSPRALGLQTPGQSSFASIQSATSAMTSGPSTSLWSSCRRVG